MTTFWKWLKVKLIGRSPIPMPPGAVPDLKVGDIVRLRKKPERLRRVLSSEWHRRRGEFVYVVEISTSKPFVPFWTLNELEVIQQQED
jgi:hypothetical protein